MEFHIVQDRLNQVLDSTDPIVEEIIIQFGEHRVVTSGANPQNSAMVLIELEEEAFEKYDGDETRKGVDLVRLQEIIGMASSDDVVKVDEVEGGDKFRIQFEGLSYTMGLISVDSIREGSGQTPNLDWDAEFTIPSSKLSQGKTACDMVSDHMMMEINDNVLMMKADGDTDNVEVEVEPVEEDVDEDDDDDDDDDEIVGLEYDELPDDCSATYSLDYVGGIIDAIPSNTQVNVSFGDAKPIVITFEIADGAGTVSYVVAPRVQT